MPTLPQEQPNVNELTADEAAASLSFATRLSEQFLMPKMQPEEEMTEEAPEEEEMTEETDTSNVKAKKIETPEEDFESEVMDELTEIKGQIQELLKEDSEESEEENAKTDTGKEE